MRNSLQEFGNGEDESVISQKHIVTRTTFFVLKNIVMFLIQVVRTVKR